jgi:ADP-heptose:LPS heptosyltransferase
MRHETTIDARTTGQQPSMVMLVDFNGLGSACLAVPVLQELEKAHPGIRYSYPENVLLADPVIREAAGVDGLVALTPPLWRRFYRRDWQEIADFIDGHAVDTVVNFRNRDLSVDPAYAEFRDWYAQRGRDIVWKDLYGLADIPSLSGQERMRQVLASTGLPTAAPTDQHWLRPLAATLAEPRPVRSVRRVGLFCGASTFSKRWPMEYWTRTVETLAGDDGIAFDLFSGSSGDEQDAARELAEQLGSTLAPGRLRFVDSGSLRELLPQLVDLDVLVVGDTGIGHLAGACGTPTLSLFLSTDPVAWAPASQETRWLQGRIGTVCPCQRPLQGNCTQYYGGCDAPCRWDLLPAHVVRGVCDVLATPRHVLPSESRDDAR